MSSAPEPAPARPRKRPSQAPAREVTVEPREGYLALARVVRAHGIRGEVRIISFNPDAPNLQRGARVMAGEREFEIVAIRPAAGGWIVSFGGITSRGEAEEMHGLLLEAPEAGIQPEPGAFFVHELLGLAVVTETGDIVGTVVEVLQPGANDVYVVDGPSGEVLVPAIDEVVRAIDVAGGRIVITPLPGLLNESL